ncbi:hypothetical protein Deia_00467 [Candidatus Deianiraea vastatrix]|uniref:Uncharacterized protein n=1 Tax=Candidatus Deianiraea vastatrix TaxID=2163644 RepID=A0A5B8XHI4_9RICK|nr:hypothetical protein Deia_00467 [Candidatus Deianiraea vastatrix]
MSRINALYKKYFFIKKTGILYFSLLDIILRNGKFYNNGSID